MKEYCENPLCQNKAVKEVPVSVEKPSDQVRSLCAACEEAYTWGVQHGTMICQSLKIDPPPEDWGDEPLFRVVYMIDVNAGSVREAAEYTYRIMTDPRSQRPVLQVIDFKSNSTEVDLSEDEDLDDDERSANYEAAAQYLADEGDKIFTGPMAGGLWNGRCLDACMMSKKKGDKRAYKFLLKFGNQYALNLSADKQRQWQAIKDHAAALLEDKPEGTTEPAEEPAIDSFTKTTVGFVAQTFRKTFEGRFVCTRQEFIAGDQCDYEDRQGNAIKPPDYAYQPYHMTLRAQTSTEIIQGAVLARAYEAIEEVLESLDVGGEQSRQFAEEIKILKGVIGHREPAESDSNERERSG